MTWEPQGAAVMASGEARVQVVDVPYFPDEVDAVILEPLERMARTDPRCRQVTMALATPRARNRMGQVARLSDQVGPRGVASILEDLIRERQLVILRWRD